MMTLDPLTNIKLYLAEVRRRLLILSVVRDSGLFLFLVSLFCLILLLIAPAVSSLATLQAIGGLSVLAGFSAFLLQQFVHLRRQKQTLFIARYVGQIKPILLSDLISTVELDQDLQRGQARFSPVLYNALTKATWTTLRQYSQTTFVSPRHLRRVAILACVGVMSWALVAAVVPQQLERGASELFSMIAIEEGEVASEPLVGDIALTYYYPSYTGRAMRVVQGTTGQIMAPRGTRVVLETSSLFPVAEARLRLQWRGDQQHLSLPLQVKGNQHLRGELVVSGEGLYRFELQTMERSLVRDALPHPITMETDVSPRAKLYGPANDLEVSTQHHLEIGFTVEDDFGLKHVELVYQIGAAPPDRLPLWRATSGLRQRRVTDKLDWELATVDLYAGARVGYWIEAFDNDTISGPKLGRSATRYVRVYSAEEKYEQALAQFQQVLEQAIRSLADRLLLFAKEPPISAHLRLTKTVEVHRTHSVLVDGLRELRNVFRQQGVAPKTLLRTISSMHKRMNAQMELESEILKEVEPNLRQGQVKGTHLTAVHNHNQGIINEMEQDTLLLAHLLDEQRLQLMLAGQHKLRDSYKRLGELLKEYRQTKNQALKKKLLQQMARMERQLNHLLTQLKQLKSSIPDEYLNVEAMDHVHLEQDLQALAQLLEQGRLSQLEAAFGALGKKLQHVQSLLEGNLKHYRDQRLNKREQAFSDLLDRLRGLENEQRHLSGRTRQIIHRYRKRATQIMKNTIVPFVRQEQAKLEALRKKVNEIDPQGLSPYDQEQLDRVKQRVMDLKSMLEQGNLEESLHMIRRAKNGLQVLQDDITDEMDGQSSWRKQQLRRSQRRARTARQIAEEIEADLHDIFPSPQSLLEGKDFQELRQLGRQQRAVRKQLQKLQGELDKNKKNASFFGPESAQGMSESAELMEKAVQKLRGTNPQEAHSAQEGAADRLAQLVKQMRQARQPMMWGGAGAGGPRERIEIPGAEAFHPPKEFREDILEAMKEKAPARYKQQVKKYYEELVR